MPASTAKTHRPLILTATPHQLESKFLTQRDKPTLNARIKVRRKKDETPLELNVNVSNPFYEESKDQSAGFRGEVKKKNLTLQPKLSGFLVKLSRFYALVGGLFVKFFMKNLTEPTPRARGPCRRSRRCRGAGASAYPTSTRGRRSTGACTGWRRRRRSSTSTRRPRPASASCCRSTTP